MEQREPEIFLCLGSNEGDRLGLILHAGHLIEKFAGPIRLRSSIYETEPWNMVEAEPFLNQVIQVSCTITPRELLVVLQEIERQMGRLHDERIGIPYTESTLGDPISRIQDQASRPEISCLTSYASRPIDIDILFYGKAIINTPELIIPHRYIADRRFVLVPMAEIAAKFVHPELEKTIGKLLEDCRDSGNVRIWA